MTRSARLAIEAVSVVNTFETFAGGPVTISNGVSVDVSVTLTGSTRNVLQWIAVKSIGAHLTMMAGVTLNEKDIIER